MKIKWLVLLIVIGFAVISGLLRLWIATLPSAQEMRTKMRASAKTQPDQNIHLTYFGIQTAWRKLAGGSVLEADFSVINVHTFPVKDIKISCSLFAPSRTVIGSKTITLYHIFPPGLERTQVKNINLGYIDQQVSDVICTVDSAIPMR